MLRFRVTLLAAVLFLLVGMPSSVHTATLAAPFQAEPPLRSSEPVETIVADLESFIPEFMRQQAIPGVGIALIQDGEVVWTEGFGVSNRFTRQPVSSETLFEVASNSKVVTAYIALRLVDQGLLSLDEPLNDYLTEPWLPPSEYRDAITLRHVLSHTSGLGHGTPSRENIFPPGRGYSYSAVGFSYLQAVIEEVTGQPLERAAREMVFTPLGMSSSSFINRAEFIPRTANGHLHAILSAILFAALYLASLVMVGLIGWVVQGIRTGRWRPTRRLAIISLIAALFCSLLLTFLLARLIGLVELAWPVALYGIFVATAFTLFFLAGRLFITRIAPKRPTPRFILTIVWSVLIFATLIQFSNKIPNLPVPKWPPTSANAAGSLRATAGDLAAFLIELANPQHLSTETASQMQSSQVVLKSDLSWGLGPGIQHSRQGDALWQWGQHLDFQSVMVIYPESRFGVVVCTNNDLLNPETALEIAYRALGGKIEPIRRGLHLEFNYREGE